MLKLADHEQLIFRLNNRQEVFVKTLGSYMASVWSPVNEKSFYDKACCQIEGLTVLGNHGHASLLFSYLFASMLVLD